MSSYFGLATDDLDPVLIGLTGAKVELSSTGEGDDEVGAAL